MKILHLLDYMGEFQLWQMCGVQGEIQINFRLYQLFEWLWSITTSQVDACSQIQENTNTNYTLYASVILACV